MGFPGQKVVKKAIRFIAWGVPAGLLAIPLNYALVQFVHIQKPGAYAIVLIFQVALNFFICRHLVFEKTASSSLRTQFAQFVGGILTIRAADWALYSLLVGFFGNYFLVLQVINALLFAWLKFRFSERVMEGRADKAEKLRC